MLNIFFSLSKDVWHVAVAICCLIFPLSEKQGQKVCAVTLTAQKMYRWSTFLKWYIFLSWWPSNDCCHRSLQTSQPGTPRLSPTFSGTEALEHPQAQRVHRGPFGSAGTLDAHRFPSYSSAFSSSSESTTSSSSPPESSLSYRAGFGSAGRGQELCIQCMDNQVIAALVPCGHNLFCLDCATRICQGPDAVCPVCLSPVTQAIQLRNMWLFFFLIIHLPWRLMRDRPPQHSCGEITKVTPNQCLCVLTPFLSKLVFGWQRWGRIGE